MAMRRSLPSDREFCAIVDLIATGFRVLWTKKLLFVVLAAASLIALSGPESAVGMPFPFLLTVSIGIGGFLTSFGVMLGSYVVVLGARAGLSTLAASQISGVFVCFLLTPIFLELFTDAEPFSETYMMQLGVALGVLVTVSLGVAFIFSSFVDEDVQQIFEHYGLGAGQHALLQLDPLQTDLPESIRGPVQFIEVHDNRITVTTDKGAHSLQMSLISAIQRLKTSQGLRIHRSIWINETQMDRLFYENGNPRLAVKSGASWPVSRTMVGEIKRTLKARS